MMEFTGERYVPSLRGQIYYEHLHRYAIAARFCAGKRVLDIASGEGYGSALLARTAAEVIGVDIDQRAVDHARRTYYAANLRFLRGSTSEIPLAEGSIDVIASFETIEHVTEHERMLDEIRRVLAPGGVLVISSPNKLVYSDEPQFENPFHEKELYFAELRDLLVRRFRHVAFYGQRLTASSVVHPLAGAVSEGAGWFNGSFDGVRAGLPTLRDPVYFVALCSDAPLTIDASSSYVDSADDLLADIWGELNTLRGRAEIGAERRPALAADATLAALPARHPEAEAEAEAEAAVAVAEAEAVAASAEAAAVVAEHAAECNRLTEEAAAAALHIATLEGDLMTAVEVRMRLEAELGQLRSSAAAQAEDARAASARERERFNEETARLREAFEAERALLEDRLALESERAHALAASSDDLSIELERERERAVVASADLYEMRTRNAALLHQLAELRAAKAARDAEHAAVLGAVRFDLASTEERLGIRREEAEALRAELERTQAELATLGAHAAGLAEALEDARRDSVALREVLSSRSWKITSPLRRAFGTMRR